MVGWVVSGWLFLTSGKVSMFAREIDEVVPFIGETLGNASRRNWIVTNKSD